jgi:hypothetical protein
MLNLKKGLALVLAAATAFTFAPVASLEASAKTIIDWDENTIQLNAGGSKTFKIKDLLKLNGVDNGYGYTVAIDNADVAVIDNSSKTGSNNTLTQLASNNTITGDVTATGQFKSFKNLWTATSEGFAKDGELTIKGVSEGTTTLRISLLDSVNHQEAQSETFTINVGRRVSFVELAKTSASATKKNSNKPVNDAGVDHETIAVTQIGNLPGLESGYQYKIAAKSSDEGVVKASIDGTDTNNGTWATSTSGLGIKLEYQGVGSTTVTVTLTKQKTDGSNKTELATKDINVTVDNATDSLAVEYDGNRDGVLDKTSVDASLGEELASSNVSNLGSQRNQTSTGYAVSGAPGSTNGSVAYLADGSSWQYNSTASKWYKLTASEKVAPTLYLDTVNNKTADIKATDALGRNITFESSWSGITVDNNGHVEILDTALNHQNIANVGITVSVPYTGSGDKLISGLSIYIPINVANKDTTNLTVKKDNGETIAKTVGGTNISSDTTADDLIAKGAVVYLSLKDKKTAVITSESNAGANYISGAVYENIGATKSSDIVSYSNGTLTALKPGKAIVRIQARNSANTYGDAYVYFVAEVTTKNANNKITVDPSVINLTAGNKTATINAKSTYKSTLKYELVKAIGDKETVTSSDIKVDSAKGTVEYTSANTGVAYIRVSGSETAESVAPDAAYVTVNFSSTKAASTLAVKSDKTVNLKVGDSSQIVASGSSVTYKSANENVATVDAGGNITAKGVGATVITVSSPEDATHMAGVDYVTVIVSSADVKTPAKVIGVKVTNKKGGYVTVTWNKQNQKNIKYYVKKTVGKKSSGKSVNGGKTTLVVKKGATVKVKVKAYVYDATGKKLVGAYSTTVTKKTDKK